MTRSAPSIAILSSLKDVTPELAKHIRHIWKDAPRAEILKAIDPMLHHGFLSDTDYGRMLWIDKVAGYYGVEYLGTNRTGHEVHALNSGDCYTETLVFAGSRMFVSTTADLIETGYIRKQKQQF